MTHEESADAATGEEIKVLGWQRKLAKCQNEG